MPTEDFDIVIIGGGPAGLSAGIYAARADLNTLIHDKPDRLLEKVESIENYFGFPGGVSGAKLLDLGRKQARKFEAEIVEKEALITRMEDEIYVEETADEEYRGKV